MPKVYNSHHRDAPPGAVYVGRGSKWGNPFTHIETVAAATGITHVSSREEAIACYTRWLDEHPELDFTELTGKDLVCYCAPKPCHADVLLRLANE